MSRQWFRMYAEAVDDEKLRLLAFEDRWHFVALLCLKAQGTLDSDAPHLERRIALKLGLQLPQLDELKRRLIEVRLIDEDWQPLNWDKRQFESDISTERVRAFRQRKRNVSETDQRQNRTDTEQNRTEQREKRATRLPDDFSLTEERRLVAEAERLPAERTFAKFCDYWRAAQGAKARKLDWDATWRNWCRNERDRLPASARPQSKFDAAKAALGDTRDEGFG